ncbi:unnamed protein product [Arabidopsis arenosa]|uniref:Retrotransposon gag domain-containing protein n=1 Tax=Arabidopsis arenosa TaxID=38785 RepID=A0A8S2AWE2_ARAAE|nr:unnamed protein product [Arabidopsis arenosa]
MAKRGRARGVPHEARPVAPGGRGVHVVPGTPPHVPNGPQFPPPPPPNVVPMEDMRQMLQSMSQMFAQNAAIQQTLLQQLPQAAVPQPAQQANPQPDYWVLQDWFKKEVGLQKFEGSSDPMEAEKWLDLVKEALGYLGVPEVFKLRMVTHQLAGDAQHWWRSIVTSRPDMELTWDDFQRAFVELYFPESVRSNLRMRFEELKQKDKTMREYQAEFDRLSRYGSHIIPDDRSRARRFEHGLRDSIRVVVEPQRLPTYAGVLEYTLIVEGNEKKTQTYVGSGSKMTQEENEDMSKGASPTGHKARDRYLSPLKMIRRMLVDEQSLRIDEVKREDEKDSYRDASKREAEKQEKDKWVEEKRGYKLQEFMGDSYEPKVEVRRMSRGSEEGKDNGITTSKGM